MDWGRVAMLSAMYLIFLTMLTSIVRPGTFPPPLYEYTLDLGGIGIWTLSLSYTDILAIGALMITGLVLVAIASLNIFGSGFRVDAKLTFVVGMGLFFSFAIGYALISLFSEVPIEFQAILVWPFLLAFILSTVGLAAGSEQ